MPKSGAHQQLVRPTPEERKPMRKHIATISAVSILAATGIAGVTPAQATAIPGAITSLTTTGQAVKAGDVLTLTAGWAVPDHSKAGDTFTLDLPTALIPLATDFPLKNAAGETVAVAHVANGKVVVTLTEFVAANPLNVKGTLNFSVRVSDQVKPGQQVPVSWGGKSILITVSQNGGVGPKVGVKPGKYLWQTPAGVGSAIDVPGELSNGVVVDTPKNLAIKCETLRVTKGTIKAGKAGGFVGVSPVSLSCAADGFTLGLPHLNSGEVAHIEYYSTLNPGEKQAVNSWSVKGSQWSDGGTVTKAILGAGGTGDGENLPPVTPTPSVTPEAPEPSETPSETPEPSATPTPESSQTPATPEPSETPTETPATPDTKETPSTPAPTPSPTTGDTASPSAPVAVTSSSPTTKAPAPSASPAASKSPEKLANTGANGLAAAAILGAVLVALGFVALVHGAAKRNRR